MPVDSPESARRSCALLALGSWGLAGAALLLAPGPAHANGQTTHLWITEHALTHLPDGELADVLLRDDLRPMLRNGTMFPDGGYAVDDGYGEIAHWEPFQGAYREWIRTSFPDAQDEERARHVAFLMGLASHGMADQVFDALYMERAKQYDASSDWAHSSMDEATDVAFAARTGPQAVPEEWVPYEELASLFASASGHAVDPETLESGQFLLAIAVEFVGFASQDPDVVAGYEEAFPWATAHLLDEEVPGAPPCEGEVIARYWQEVWDRLSGDVALDPAVIATIPGDGARGHPRDAGSVESRVSVVFAQGIDAATVVDGAVRVVDSRGAAHPVSHWLFYGGASHVLHAAPEEDWAPDEDFTVTVEPGLRTADGGVLEEPWSFTFSTRAEEAGDGPGTEPDGARDEAGCGCGAGAAPGPGVAWAAMAAAAVAAARGRARRTGGGTRDREEGRA